MGAYGVVVTPPGFDENLGLLQGARASADTTAFAFGSVLRTTACGSGRSVRHSFAGAALGLTSHAARCRCAP